MVARIHGNRVAHGPLRVAGLCAALLCCICGCRHSDEDSRRPEPKAVVYMLLDLTRPAESKVRQDYPEEVLSYARAALQKDIPKPCAFIVSFIKWRSVGGSELHIDEVFYQSLSGSVDTGDDAYKEDVATLRRIGEKCKTIPIDLPPPQGTEIFAALDVVSRNMRRFPDAEKHLYIFSDMMEQSKPALADLCDIGMDMEKLDALADDPRLLSYFNQVEGVRVFVYGADGVSSERTRNVRTFWLSIFKRAKWDLEEGDYNTAIGLRQFGAGVDKRKTPGGE